MKGSVKAPRKHCWGKDRKGASGVVVTLLVLLVAVGAISMFMAIYVPIWGKDSEATMMKRVQTQMLAVKENIDMQVLAGKTSTITTRLTIGEEGGPVFHLTQAPGSLKLAPEAGLFRISRSSDQNDSQGLAQGALEFASENRYYVDQKLRYENGALLVIQGSRTVMKASPHFESHRESDGNLTASITLISLGGTSLIKSGTGDVTLESTLDVYDVTTYTGGDWITGRNVSINITTGYPGVWADYFNSSMSRSGTGLVAGTDYVVSVWPGGVNATLVNLNRLELGIAVVELQLR